MSGNSCAMGYVGLGSPPIVWAHHGTPVWCCQLAHGKGWKKWLADRGGYMTYLDHMVWPRSCFKMDFHRNRTTESWREHAINYFHFGVSMGVLFYCIVSSRCPVLIHPYYMGWENHWNYHQHPPTKKTIDYIKGNQIRQRNIQDLLYIYIYK